MAIVYIDSGSFNSLSVTGSFTTIQTIQGTSSFALTASVAPNYVLNNVTSSFATTSSFNSFTSSINGVTGSYITTGSSGVSQTISGSLIINQNLTVLGSSSITYVTSSQLNIGTNLITVNTATPSVRFGGLAVFDSGSTGTGRTGSMLWDSQNDVWIYSNPSGAAYDGALVLMGPRNSTGLGNEVGINSGYAAVGNGSHHMTSSAIYSSGSLIRLENNTQITGSLIVSAGITGSFSGSVFGYVSDIATSSFVTNSQTSSMTVATASYVTGSIYTSTNPALSASYALSSSNADNVYSALVTGGTNYGIVLAATGATGYKTLSNTANTTISVIPNVGRIAATSMTASAAFNATASAIGFVGTASNAVSSSYALTASYALTSAGGGTISTASLLTTASATNNVITFTKGDASTFTVTVATGSGGGTAFPFTGDASITGSLTVTGSASTLAPLHILSGSTSLLYVSGSGRIGIGKTTPTSTLDVNGNTIITGSLTTSTTILSTGTLVGSSFMQANAIDVALAPSISNTVNNAAYKLRNSDGTTTAFQTLSLNGTFSAVGQYSLWMGPSAGYMLGKGNGLVQIIRAGIQIANPIDTAASESADMIFLTKPGSPANTAMTERIRILSTGNTLISGSLIASSSVLSSVGSVSAPGHSFEGSTNYGMYLNGTTLGLVNAGTSVINIGSSNQVQLPNAWSAAAGAHSLVVGTAFPIRYNTSAANYFPCFNIQPDGGSTAGGVGLVFDSTATYGGIVLTAGNATPTIRAIPRVVLKLTNLVNTNDTESADFSILSKTAGVPSSSFVERFRISSAGSTIVSGSLIVTGSSTQIGTKILTGSLNISGSITLTSGSVTMPNRSAFRVYGSSVTGIPSTTTISGSATTVDYNQGNNYDNTTGVYTAPTAGLYHVYFNCRTNSGATQQAIVYKNRVGGVGGTSMLMWETTGSNSGHFGVSSILNLAANDTLQAVVALGTVQFDSNDNWGAAYIG